MNKSEWSKFKNYLENIFSAITGKYIKVSDIEQTKEGELGYTTPIPSIHLANEHPCMKGFSDSKKKFFILGVFAHELLHQVYSDFNVLESTLLKYKRREQRILADISNILEDPAIEYFAPSILGGKILKALNFSIAEIYKKSPPLQESTTPFCQYLNALIQFGDMGFLKGHFTFENAKKVFNETISIFNEGIKNPSAYERMSISIKIMEMSKELWDVEDDAFYDLMDALEEMLSNMGKNSSDITTGQLLPIDSDFLEDDSSKNKRREDLVKKMTNSNDGDSEEQSDEDGPIIHDGDAVRNDSLRTSNMGSLPDIDFNETKKSNVPVADGCIDWDEYEPTDVDIEDLLSSIEAFDKAKKHEQIKKTKEEKLDYEVTSARFSSARCVNKVVKTNKTAEDYNKIVVKTKLHHPIRLLAKELKRLFNEDEEEKIYRTSGKIDLERYSDGKVSARIFNKHKDPVNKSNCCFFLLVDESGSMGGNKINQARNCAMLLVEACNLLKIPVYVMGFTTGYGYDAYHNHYIRWKDNKCEKFNLLDMKAHNCNFDGYSIRYSGEILKKFQAEHKLLIVISDGTPSHCMPNMDAVADTREAIRDVRKFASVLGISVDNDDEETLHYFYGTDFIHINNPNVMIPNFINKIKKIVKGW